MRGALAVAACLAAGCGAPRGVRRCAELQVVKVDYDNVERGAGIVFRVLPDRVFVATAAHVVQPSDDPANVRVGFRSRLPTLLPVASVTPRADLDLAVLEVMYSADFTADDLCLLRATAIELHAHVHYIGHPAKPVYDNWAHGRGVVMSFTPPLIRFRTGPDPSAIPSAGFSGGAVYDDRWRLVGMITNARESTRDGFARDFSAIKQVFETLDTPIPVDLRTTPRPRDVFLGASGGARFGLDDFVSPRAPRFELGGAMAFTRRGPLSGAVAARGWVDPRERRPIVHQYPGGDVTTGTPRKQWLVGGSVGALGRVELWRLALVIDYGFTYQRITDGSSSGSELGTTLGFGAIAYVGRWLSARWGLGARGRVDLMFNPFEVRDFHFTLSGAPGPAPRALDDNVFTLSIGPELWF